MHLSCASCKKRSAKASRSSVPKIDISPQELLSLEYSISRAQKTILLCAEQPQLDPKHKPSPGRLVLFVLLRPRNKSVFWHDSVMPNSGVCDGVWMCLDRHQTLNPVQQHISRQARQGMTAWH